MIAIVLLVVGIAFGGWLRGTAEVEWRLAKEAQYYRGRFRRAVAWDIAKAVRALVIVAGCGLVRHRWRVDGYNADVVECLRCGKIDWHPTKGPNATDRSKGSIATLQGMPGRSAPRSPNDPNLLTEFGSGGYGIVSKDQS